MMFRPSYRSAHGPRRNDRPTLTVSLSGAKTRGAKAIANSRTDIAQTNSSRDTPKRSWPAGFTIATCVQFTAVSVDVTNAVNNSTLLRVVDQLSGF
jgi:hypothetical protein